LFSSFKGDFSLPWEHRKPLTPASLAEAAKQTGKYLSVLGPATLRRTAGASSSASPVSALFMSEVARTNTLTPSQLTAGGRSVAVDVLRMDSEDELDSLPAGALRPAGSSVHYSGGGGGGAGGGGMSSQFLPNRPDDHAHASSGAAAVQSVNVANAATVQKSGTVIARPDLLLNGGGAGGPGAGGAGGGANGFMASAGSDRSARSVSTAATLLSAGLNSAGSNGSSNNNHSPAPPAPSRGINRAASQQVGGSDGAAKNATSAPQRKLLTKVASFFGGR
jgi:hypothetical protein